MMLMLRELTPEENEFVKFVKTGKDQLWLENKKLRAALKQAAEIVAKNYCPANYDCPLEDTECGGGAECTQEIAERCWMEFWMGER